MRIKKIMGLLLALGMSMSGAVFGKKMAYPSTLSLDRPDVDLSLSGRIRQEFFYLDKVSSLRENYNDTYAFWRNKVNLGLYIEHGKQQYGEPAVEGKITLTAFNYWNNANKYTPQMTGDAYFDEKDFRKRALYFENRAGSGLVPLLYQEEAWLAINADVFWKKLEKFPTTLKFGYFPYQVGRGVSLGDYFAGGVEYMGWAPAGNAGNATQAPVGALIDVELSDHFNLELYYSQLNSRSTSPTQTRAATRSIRLDVPFESTDPQAIERGINGDDHIFAAKMDIDYKLGKKGKIHLEPYMVYALSPEQTIEVEAPLGSDAKSELGTLGLMAEFEHKKNGFVCNVEAAFQFGEQEMYAIDRNHEVLKTDSDGVMRKYYSHVTYSPELPTVPLEATKASGDYIYSRINRGLAEQGAVIKDASGSALSGVSKTVSSSLPNATLKPSNGSLEFGHYKRFRKGYKVKYRGKMLMADASWYISKKPLTRLSVCAAYISGGDYPYNTTVDKDYKGFLPLRDSNYFGYKPLNSRNGYGVQSFAMLYARKLPRPKNIAEHKFYAYNDDSSMTNLMYVGIGGMLHPFWHPKKLIIMGGILGYWNDKAPFSWDKKATRSFGDPERSVTSIAEWGGIKLTDQFAYGEVQKKLNFAGAQTSSRASSYVGTEINMTVVWNPLKNLEVVGLGAVFFPGKLYKDIDGQPNRNTRRFTANGDVHYESLGSKMVFGTNVRVTYKF